VASFAYRPSLDGLRTVAVGLVVLFHCGLTTFAGGFVGVDLFFVLSGFLVTSILWAEVAETGRLRFGGFYSRRVRRLLPAAVVVIGITSAFFVLVAPVTRRLPWVADAQSALLYFANWHFLEQGNDYFGADIDRSPFLHFWSLSIEEQYYLFLPVLLLVLWRLGRGRKWVPLLALTILFALSLAAQVHWGGVDVNHAYYGTDARLYQMFAGSVLALLVHWGWSVRDRVAGALAAAAVVVLLLASTDLVSWSASDRGIAAMVAGTALVAGLVGHETGPIARLLSLPVPVYLGRISYGIYLWHWPLMLALKGMFDLPVSLLTLSVAAGATALAALSYRVLEMPIRTGRWGTRFPVGVVLGGLTTSALVAGVFVSPVLGAPIRPALMLTAPVDHQLHPPTPASDLPVPSGIDWRRIAKDIGPDDVHCTRRDLTRCIAHRGTGPRVVLIGDSHARALAPMFTKLAQEQDFTLMLNLVSACTWQRGLENFNQPKSNREQCAAARSSWYDDVLPRLHPNVVILSSMARSAPNWGKYIRLDGAPAGLSRRELWTRATRDTLDRIKATGARSLLIDSLWGTGGFDPLDCLSTAKTQGECTVAAQPRTLVDDVYAQVAKHRKSVFAVDLNPVFCRPGPACEPLDGRVVVWRNPEHYSTAEPVKRRDEVARLIRRTGVWHTTAD
jgi:peptidoglycan/LPS O-acetylase OafA/YrhL